jgi:signal transduction histidine kinase
MRDLSGVFGRGRVVNFSRNSYETVFSVFMVAVVYLYRGNAQIVYPEVLYFFLLLLGSNLIFNLLLRRRLSVSLWAIDLILAFNLLVITGVLYYSGGQYSHFWVLYLLPVFASALLVSMKDVAGVVFLCALSVGGFAWPLDLSDLAAVMSLVVKISVFTLSAAVVHRTAETGKKAEAALTSKRREVETMSRKLLVKDSEIVMTASAGEVGRLAEGLIHDLGNSISVILLSAQIVLEDEHMDKKDIERIIKAAMFSKDVISNALSLARGREYVFAPGHVREPLERSVQLLGYSAKKKGVVITTELGPDLPALNMSRVHLERLFINILSNALSFSPKNGEVKIGVTRTAGGIEIKISDNGPGFSGELLKDGIQAFGTTRKESGGIGLGLYVCAQITAKHDGTIGVSNGSSGGAVVTVTLPALKG